MSIAAKALFILALLPVAALALAAHEAGHVAARIDDNSLNGVLGQLLAYWYELDQGRPEAAAAHLRPVLERIERTPAIYRGTLFLEAAYHDAVHGMDAARARAWLERARAAPVEGHLRSRAEAAVLLAEGDARAALQCIARAEQALGTSIEAGMVLAHSDELRALRHSAFLRQIKNI